MRRALLLGLVLVALSASGCATAVGEYFADRARDFGDCWRAEAGPTWGAGVSVRAAGIAHVGLECGIGGDAGWRYGEFVEKGPIMRANLLFLHTTDLLDRDRHWCWGLLPAAFSWDGRNREWIWEMEGAAGHWFRLHAFDIEVSLTLIAVNLRLGFSPGEFLDFLLGWFGLDIAGDDWDWP